MGHSLDFDDLTPWGNHATSSIVPPALAFAERIGGVSGKDMLAAVAIGQNLFTRILCNVDRRKDWNMSTVAGVFAGTTAVGYLVKLSREQVANDLAIAGMQSAGTMEVICGVGSDLRGMYAGFSAKVSVVSALLAGKGITGAKSMFDGKAGFFNTYFGGRHDRAKLLKGLGRDLQREHHALQALVGGRPGAQPHPRNDRANDRS